MAIASRPSSSARAGTLRRRLQPALGVTFWSFVVLGMSDAALGTAWPAIRSSLDLPIGDLGLIQLTGTAGFLTASLVSGRVAAGLGRSGSLLAAAGLAVTGMGLFASAPALAVLLLSALVIGLAGGSIEPGMQSHVTLSSSSRTMNLLHGFYGLGATIGPLLVSGLLLLHASWRFAYLVLLCGEALVGAGVIRRRRAYDTTTPARLRTARPSGGPAEGPHVPAVPVAPVPAFALATAVLLFAVYCGVEVGTGQWAFSLLTGARHLGTGLAGALVAGFWAALTLGRLAIAALGDRGRPDRLLVLSAAGSVVGECLLWWNPDTAVGALGLLVAGGSLAPAFPLMMIRTPIWVPGPKVSAVIGWQSASASIGIAAFSALAALLVESFGLATVCPFLSALSIAFLVLQIAAISVQNRRRVRGTR